MIVTLRTASLLFMALMFTCEVRSISSDSSGDLQFGPKTEEDVSVFAPYLTNQEYNRHIHSLMNAYKADAQGGRMVIETNALIDTKYKTWKRNADLINSILALPKGMNDAGR